MQSLKQRSIFSQCNKYNEYWLDAEIHFFSFSNLADAVTYYSFSHFIISWFHLPKFKNDEAPVLWTVPETNSPHWGRRFRATVLQGHLNLEDVQKRTCEILSYPEKEDVTQTRTEMSFRCTINRFLAVQQTS